MFQTIIKQPLRIGTGFFLAISLMLAPGSSFADVRPQAVEEEQTKTSFSEIEKHIARFSVSEKDFEALQEILARSPNDCYAHFLLCRCYERKGLVDLADEQLAIVHKLETKPEDILRRLRHHIESGELAEAFTMAPIAMEKSPNDPSILLLKALFQQNNGLTASAETILTNLIKRDDCPLGAATALAAIRLDGKHYQEAIDLSDRDIKLNSGYLGARLTRCQALLSLGRFKEVTATLKEPLKDHPFSQRLTVLMYDAYRRQGMFEAALHCALRNLACSDYITYYEHAQNKVKELLEILPPARSRKIIAEESEVIGSTVYAMKFHFFLGQVFFKMGRGLEAREQVQKSLDLDPLFQPNWYEMGRIKEVFFGDFAGAGRDFQQAHSLQRSDIKASVAFQRVAARARNSRRDFALALKNKLRRVT